MKKTVRLKAFVMLLFVAMVLFAISESTLAESEISDEFDMDELNDTIWKVQAISQHGMISLSEGKLHMELRDVQDKAEIGIRTLDVLEGDFDIQVDWEVSADESDTGQSGLRVVMDEDNYAYIARAHCDGEGLIIGTLKDRGYEEDIPTVSTEEVSGRFRITRTGTTIRFYYDIGDGWQHLGEDYVRAFLGEVYVQLDTTVSDSSSDVIGQFGNFTAKEVNWDGIINYEKFSDDPLAMIHLGHLDYLGENIMLGENLVRIIHPYAEAPDYAWRYLSWEGYACVDASLAAVNYLQEYQKSKDEQNIKYAKRFLEFVEYMRSDTGDYHAWLDNNMVPSVKHPGATARAIQALGYACRFFVNRDPEYASVLKTRMEFEIVRALQEIKRKGARSYTEEGIRLPWMLSDDTTNISRAALGWIDYYLATKDPRVAEIIEFICNRMLTYQLGTKDEYPFKAIVTYSHNVTLWNAWGTHQVSVLARAGQAMGREDWIAGARETADNWDVHRLIWGQTGFEGMNPARTRFPQIAMQITNMALGFFDLYKATGEEKYACYAGLTMSWFFGNNDANTPMYDPLSGRFFDAIVQSSGSIVVMKSSGAETIMEALYGIFPILDDPVAKEWTFADKTSAWSAIFLEAEHGEITDGEIIKSPFVSGAKQYFSNDAYVAVNDDGAITWNIEIENPYDDLPRDYLLYIGYPRATGRTAIEVILNGETMFVWPEEEHMKRSMLGLDKIGVICGLSDGANTIQVRANDSRVEIDYLLLQPIVERATFETPKGVTTVVERDLRVE